MAKASEIRRRRQAYEKLHSAYLAGPAMDNEALDACLEAREWLRENDPSDPRYEGSELPPVSRGFWFRFKRFHRFFVLWTYLGPETIAEVYSTLAQTYANALEHLSLLRRAGGPELPQARMEAADAREQLAAAIFYVPEGKTRKHTAAERMLDDLDRQFHFRIYEIKLGLEPVS